MTEWVWNYKNYGTRYEGYPGRRNITIDDLHVSDVVTIYHRGEPEQCFCVTETGERFRVRPATDADYPPGRTRGHWPDLWLDFDTLTQEQIGATDECHICAGELHYNTLLTAPGELNNDDDDWDEECHCGHDYGNHAFHSTFCRRCKCDSFHRAGENYDQITDRWN